MKCIYAIIACLCMGITSAQAEPAAVTTLLSSYKAEGASATGAAQGKLLWEKRYPGKAPFNTRSCTTCHEQDLTQPGRHIKTRKRIKPMAPSVNTRRLTDIKEIEKWLRRNCKWTMNRECSPSEKASLLTYLSQQ